jgi:hypothetical protein
MWVNISMASTFVFSLSYFPWVGGDLRHFFAARGRFMLFLALQKVHFESAQLSNITYSVIRRCKCCYNKQAFERTLLEFSGCCQISHPFLPLLNPVIRWKWRCSYACIIHDSWRDLSGECGLFYAIQADRTLECLTRVLSESWMCEVCREDLGRVWHCGIIFRVKIHVNDVFLFFKNYFWYQYIKTI